MRLGNGLVIWTPIQFKDGIILNMFFFLTKVKTKTLVFFLLNSFTLRRMNMSLSKSLMKIFAKVCRNIPINARPNDRLLVDIYARSYSTDFNFMPKKKNTIG